MGAWGTGNLENDAALDWLGSFTLDPSVPRVRGALRAAIDEPEYLDADVCSEALAAAEAVAAALGAPGRRSAARGADRRRRPYAGAR